MSRPVMLHKAQRTKYEAFMKVLSLPLDFKTCMELFLSVLSEMNTLRFF